MSRPSSIKIINQLGAKIFETNIAESLYNVNLSIRIGTGLYFIQANDILNKFT